MTNQLKKANLILDRNRGKISEEQFYIELKKLGAK